MTKMPSINLKTVWQGAGADIWGGKGQTQCRYWNACEDREKQHPELCQGVVACTKADEIARAQKDAQCFECEYIASLADFLERRGCPQCGSGKYAVIESVRRKRGRGK